MAESSISAAGTIDMFLVLLIGIGPNLALVPFLEITASLDQADKGKVGRNLPGRGTANASWAIEPGWSITNPTTPCSPALSDNASSPTWSFIRLRENN